MTLNQLIDKLSYIRDNEGLGNVDVKIENIDHPIGYDIVGIESVYFDADRMMYRNDHTWKHQECFITIKDLIN